MGLVVEWRSKRIESLNLKIDQQNLSEHRENRLKKKMNGLKGLWEQGNTVIIRGLEEERKSEIKKYSNKYWLKFTPQVWRMT